MINNNNNEASGHSANPYIYIYIYLRKSVLAESKLRKSVVAESWKSRLSSRTLGDRMGF